MVHKLGLIPRLPPVQWQIKSNHEWNVVIYPHDDISICLMWMTPSNTESGGGSSNHSILGYPYVGRLHAFPHWILMQLIELHSPTESAFPHCGAITILTLCYNHRGIRNWIRGSFNQEMHSCSVGEQVVGKCIATGNYGSPNCCHGDWELATFYTAFFAGGIGGKLVDSLLMVHRMIAEWSYSSKVFSMAVVKRGLMIQHIEELPMLQNAYKCVQVSYQLGCGL